MKVNNYMVMSLSLLSFSLNYLAYNIIWKYVFELVEMSLMLNLEIANPKAVFQKRKKHNGAEIPVLYGLIPFPLSVQKLNGQIVSSGN